MAADIPAAAALLDDILGGRMQARRGELVDVLEGGTGLIALDGRNGPVGVLTWRVAGGTAEVRAVAVAEPARGHGLGRALLDAAAMALRDAGVRRAWLVTTNDNTPAIRLYESVGYAITEIRTGAVDELRRTLKPSIPLVGHGGAEMHDELEFEKAL